MTTKNGDIPAIPTQTSGGYVYGGLTKREQFAMAAMQTAALPKDYREARIVAKLSVQMADALLAELAKTNGGE